MRWTPPSERERLEPIVAAGRALCTAPVCVRESRRIEPGDVWELGHVEDKSAHAGPQHRQCNRADASRQAAEARTGNPVPARWSKTRQW